MWYQPHPPDRECPDSIVALLAPFYADDVVFYGSYRRITRILILLLDRWSERGYFPDTAKLIFIINTPAEEEAVSHSFEE